MSASRHLKLLSILKTDFLIVGQGLAGSLLAWHLLLEGKRVLVVDRDEADTSSKVAAGLVTPLAGSRFNLPDGLEDRLDYARKFYWEREEASGMRFFHHLRIARLFRDAREEADWTARLSSGGSRYDRFHSPLAIDPAKYHAPHGGFEMREGGWLDVPAFLEYTRYHLLERTSYAIGKVESEEVAVSLSGIRWKNIEAGAIVFCEGWRSASNRFFNWVPMRPTPGDILDLDIPDLADENRIVNKGGWLLPLGGGRFRAGSTYHQSGSASLPTEQSRSEVLTKVAAITPALATVKEHRLGLRPTIRRSQIYMGPHPSSAHVYFFNGLGSKGVLNGPWHARRLALHLLRGEKLPPEADVRHPFL